MAMIQAAASARSAGIDDAENTEKPQPSRRSLWALDWLNFLMADVQNGLGPYLAVYLKGAHNWGAGDVGLVMAVSNIAGAVSQIPAGMLVDALRIKRLLVAAAALITAAGCLIIAFRPELAWVVGAQVAIGAAAALLPPALTALCLGLVGHRRMPAQLGRNQAFSHAGAFSAAILIGTGSRIWGYHWIFWLLCIFAAGMVAAVFSISPNDIDHRLARGANGHGPAADSGKPMRLREVFRYRRLLVFLATVVLFHLGNAAMLPMAGQVLALTHPGTDTLALSACVVVAQLVMIGVALAVGRALHAGYGRKTIFLLMLAVLPIRGLLFALFTANPWAVVAIQILDGIGAGIFSVLAVVIADDLMRGTGRFNLAQGLVALSVGIGSGLSNVTSGFIVQWFGYRNGFLYLAFIAACALVFCAAFMPETRPAEAVSKGESAAAAGGRPAPATKPRLEAPVPTRRGSRIELLAIGILGTVIGLALVAALATVALPGSVLNANATKIAAGAIFIGAYAALAIGKIPGLRIDRAGVALVGASLMVGAGVLPLDQASRAVDFGTITLLLGIMIVVANLRLSGFFALANAWVVRHVHRPIVLLAAVTLVSGLFSVFLVNDAICLVLSPLVLELTLHLRRQPMPYLLAVAMASNIGSTATITGNPQNMLIGSFSHLPYAQFTLALAPVAMVGLVLTVLLLALAYRSEFRAGDRLQALSPAVHVQKALLLRALLATGVMVALFFAGQPPAKVAIVIGGLLLLTRRLKSERIYAEIDWSLLLMFVGLFIIVAGAEHALLTPNMRAAAGRWHLDHVPMLSLITGVLSNLVSNVPAVLVLRPFIDALPKHDTAWLVVAMASTLAGNFTVLGSIANLIVVQKAASRGVSIGFWDYFKVGAPLTVLTIAFGTLWLWR
ncbi:MAG: MFS transporter [Acidobacteriia bacterium]|nr:MFS transporter [Methyloceanibacter sp.]MCL6492599.1 MFS transporter [Terriglobia bacterium]